MPVAFSIVELLMEAVFVESEGAVGFGSAQWTLSGKLHLASEQRRSSKAGVQPLSLLTFFFLFPLLPGRLPEMLQNLCIHSLGQAGKAGPRHKPGSKMLPVPERKPAVCASPHSLFLLPLTILFVK